MRLTGILIVLLVSTVLISSPASAEIKTFVGADAVTIDTKITYANGSEDYEFSGSRLRFGIENSDGGSVGIEVMSGDSNDIIDPFGGPFRLETGEAFGLYATLGKPIYVRFAFATWQTEYTDLNLSLTDKETVDSFEIGIGINLHLGRNMTFYADYSLRDTESNYPVHVTGNGDVDYESELVSVGLNILF